jgi:hypothetical protein
MPLFSSSAFAPERYSLQNWVKNIRCVIRRGFFVFLHKILAFFEGIGEK